MIGARQGSPLAIGHGAGRDVPGLRRHRAGALHQSEITYLEEGDWAVLTRKGAVIYDRAGRTVERAAHQVGGELAAGRQGQPPPLHGQGDPRAARSHQPHARQLHRLRPRGASTFPTSASTPPSISRISISACGTAYYAGLVGKYWLERYARIPVEIDIASEFRYREPPMARGGLAMFVSQSGETADTLATLRYCKAKGQQHRLHRQRAHLDDRPRVRMPFFRPLPVPRSASPPPRRSPASSACWPAWRSASAGRAAFISEAKETGTGAGAGRGAAPHLHHPARRARYEKLAHTLVQGARRALPRAAASATPSRWKAR